MSKNINLQAYESIEALSSYENRDAILDYRRSRLEKYCLLVDFISIRSPNPISLLEVGSGSSALLYALAERGLLKNGMGIELSQSRHEFAELWKREDDWKMVENINSNFCDVNMGESLWDWFVIVDNTFTYLEPESVSYPSQLLAKASQGLRKDGRLLIDFINYAKRPESLEYRQWSAFSIKDPFSYGLYSNKIKNGLNYAESIFIKRDGSEFRKHELSKVYSLEELIRLVNSFGFVIEGVFNSFDCEVFIPKESERLVLLARKG